MEAIHQSGWKRNIERNCPICGKPYLASEKYLERGKQTTCSRRCSYTLRGRQKKSRVEGVCAVCGQKFSRPTSHIKGKYGANFCCREHHYIGRRLRLTRRVVLKPYKYTKGGRTKKSKTAAHLYASGKGLTFPDTELAVIRVLTDMKIEFTHQHVVEFDDGAYVVDFLFPGQLIVELDNPSRHNRELREYDAERDRRLRKLGFRVVRLWDNGRPENAVRTVLATLLERSEGPSPM
jgi:very-short-patch-repair endonuclease